ncbi:MAG: L-rhamnose mutarotase [Thermomicrobiales bacterium]
MQRIAFRLRIKPGQRAAYIAHHANVWPDLLADLSTAGYRNYSIFVDGDDLFGYFECSDYQAANLAMATSDANRRWQAFMSDYLEASPDPDAGPATLMTEIFRLN